MTSFKIGDRVTHRDRPDERGTVEAVINESAYGMLYEVRWDGSTRGQFDRGRACGRAARLAPANISPTSDFRGCRAHD